MRKRERRDEEGFSVMIRWCNGNIYFGRNFFFSWSKQQRKKWMSFHYSSGWWKRVGCHHVGFPTDGQKINGWSIP